ncbi:MAG: hypothetical protein KGJ55_06580 [Gammaproteobacteria bacterium]|nr:hypothetical protein [Gammaproteobacteria bacterium]
MAAFEAPNLCNPQPGWYAAGQPDARQLRAAGDGGVRRVINLRPPSEDAGYDEAALADELGIDYQVLPIAGTADLTQENVGRFDVLMTRTPSLPTLVHCASGNRVGALVALRRAWLKGDNSEQALAEGRAWGLTKLEAAVRALLGGG